MPRYYVPLEDGKKNQTFRIIGSNDGRVYLNPYDADLHRYKFLNAFKENFALMKNTLNSIRNNTGERFNKDIYKYTPNTTGDDFSGEIALRKYYKQNLESFHADLEGLLREGKTINFTQKEEPSIEDLVLVPNLGVFGVRKDYSNDSDYRKTRYESFVAPFWGALKLNNLILEDRIKKLETLSISKKFNLSQNYHVNFNEINELFRNQKYKLSNDQYERDFNILNGYFDRKNSEIFSNYKSVLETIEQLEKYVDPKQAKLQALSDIKTEIANLNNTITNHLMGDDELLAQLKGIPSQIPGQITGALNPILDANFKRTAQVIEDQTTLYNKKLEDTKTVARETREKDFEVLKQARDLILQGDEGIVKNISTSHKEVMGSQKSILSEQLLAKNREEEILKSQQEVSNLQTKYFNQTQEQFKKTQTEQAAAYAALTKEQKASLQVLSEKQKVILQKYQDEAKANKDFLERQFRAGRKINTEIKNIVTFDAGNKYREHSDMANILIHRTAYSRRGVRRKSQIPRHLFGQSVELGILGGEV